jgi:hypothetical protein
MRNIIITVFDWQYLAEAFKFSASKIFEWSRELVQAS